MARTGAEPAQTKSVLAGLGTLLDAVLQFQAPSVSPRALRFVYFVDFLATRLIL
jgi:hypothetical protein